MPLIEIIKNISKWSEKVRNNAGGHFNHSFFWKIMTPNGKGKPSGNLAKLINSTFGSFDKFREEFKKAALTRFGSGWAWLCVKEDGSIFVTSTPNQDNPLMDIVDKKGFPILGLDVWEHAYYLNYQNKRGSYIDAFWKVVDWDEVERLYKSCGLKK
jgi:Fe-Mn family superoxide dismutase